MATRDARLRAIKRASKLASTGSAWVRRAGDGQNLVRQRIEGEGMTTTAMTPRPYTWCPECGNWQEVDEEYCPGTQGYLCSEGSVSTVPYVPITDLGVKRILADYEADCTRQYNEGKMPNPVKAMRVALIKFEQEQLSPEEEK